MELDEQEYVMWDGKVDMKITEINQEGASTKMFGGFCFLRGNHANNVFLQVKEVHFSAANSTGSTQILTSKRGTPKAWEIMMKFRMILNKILRPK